VTIKTRLVVVNEARNSLFSRMLPRALSGGGTTFQMRGKFFQILKFIWARNIKFV
jgi:hypothetical protein